MLVSFEAVTVSSAPLSVTSGVLLPKLLPLMVIAVPAAFSVTFRIDGKDGPSAFAPAALPSNRNSTTLIDRNMPNLLGDNAMC
jgi:hypothetical protein